MIEPLPEYVRPAINGFLLGLSLIIAPGVQNLFIIKQRVNNNYPHLAALACSLSDSTLIFISIAGIGTVISSNIVVKKIIVIISILFLLFYCYKALKSLFSKGEGGTVKDVENLSSDSKIKVFLLSVSLSWFNPQAIIDTLIIIGGTSSNFHEINSWFFGLGAALASFSWFFMLSNSARLFLQFFKSSKFERLLNLFIILVMGSILYQLILGFFIKGESL